MAGQSYNLTCNVSEPANVTLISYQWNKEGIPINNETDRILAFPSLNLDDIGTYTCQVIVEPTRIMGTSNNWTIIPQSEFFCKY